MYVASGKKWSVDGAMGVVEGKGVGEWWEEGGVLFFSGAHHPGRLRVRGSKGGKRDRVAGVHSSPIMIFAYLSFSVSLFSRARSPSFYFERGPQPHNWRTPEKIF